MAKALTTLQTASQPGLCTFRGVSTALTALEQHRQKALQAKQAPLESPVSACLLDLAVP